MTTTRQADANRLNALKSTGPRTLAGKAMVAHNATKHGLLSRESLVKGESEADLVGFGKRLRAQLAPVGELELLLVDRIVSTAWRLRRLVCVEAMLCGLPVLRTRAGGCDLQILEGKTGWAVDVGDDPSLFGKFLGAVRDPEATKRCGAAAREHALANFTEEKFLDAMVRVYESVLPGKAAANA